MKYVQFALNTYAADNENDELMFPDRHAVAPLVKQLLNFRHVGRLVYNKGPKKGKDVAPARKYDDADDYMEEDEGDEEGEGEDGAEDGERGEGKKPLYKPHPDSFTVPDPIEPGVSAGTALYRNTVADNLKMLEDAIKKFTEADPSIATTASAAAVTCVDRWAKGECASVHPQEDLEAVSDYRFCPPEYNPAAQSMDDLENLFQAALYKLLKVNKFKPFGQRAGKTQGLDMLSPYPETVVLKRRANAAFVERDESPEPSVHDEPEPALSAQDSEPSVATVDDAAAMLRGIAQQWRASPHSRSPSHSVASKSAASGSTEF